MSTATPPKVAARKSSAGTRRFALRVELNRLQLAIATLGSDGIYTIVIDEVVCSDSSGWLHERNAGQLERVTSELFDRNQVRRESIAISLDADFCVTRVAMGSAEVVDRELEMLRTRIPRYLQLGPGEKITGICRTKLAPGVEHVITGVVNLRSIQRIYDAICATDARVSWVEPSLVSVARLLGKAGLSNEPILIADGSGTHWDIGIAYQGRLLLDYRPAGASNEDALSEALDGHITRLKRFCHRHRGITSSGLNQLTIYGENEKLSRTLATLGDRNQIRVSILDVPQIESLYRIEEQYRASCYVPAIAAIMPLLTNVPAEDIPDMLGPVRRAPDRPWTLQVFFGVLPAIAATLFLMIAYGLVATERRREQDILDSRALAEAQMRQTQVRMVELTGQKELLLNLEQIEKQTRETRWDMLLNRVTQCLPDTVRMNEFRVDSEGMVRIDGVTIDETNVYDVVDHFRRLPEVREVALQGTMPVSQAEGVRFIVHLTTSQRRQAE